MSGLLDNKSRVMDTILTQEGRSQAANGRLNIKYVSFTDGLTFYRADVVSGSQDASRRAYLEACNLPQDQITFSSDEHGKLMPFGNDVGVQVKAGTLFDYSFTPSTGNVLSGSNQSTTFLVSDDFTLAARDLIASSLNNLNKMQLIGSREQLFEDEGFGVGNGDVTFTINNTSPITDPTMFTANINHLESLFSDVRLSHVDNFKFLPPVNKITNNAVDKTDYRATSQSQLGHYKPWGRTHILGLSKEQLMLELQHYEMLGCMRTISFEPTTSNNRLVAQVFEMNYDSVNKLDVIEFPIKRSTSRCFFVGKVRTDDNDSHTFIHIFTMVFG